MSKPAGAVATILSWSSVGKCRPGLLTLLSLKAALTRDNPALTDMKSKVLTTKDRVDKQEFAIYR
jgi:hypothetical protein